MKSVKTFLQGKFVVLLSLSVVFHFVKDSNGFSEFFFWASVLDFVCLIFACGFDSKEEKRGGNRKRRRSKKEQ